MASLGNNHRAGPGFYAQRAWLTNADIRHGTLMILIGSGIALAIHFAAWTWSLDHTSLAHSLLFVTSHPLVIVCAMALIRGRLDWMLIGGAALGFSGAALALLDSSPSGEVTYAGDAAAFLGAVAGAAYLGAGRVLRSTGGMPLFIYAFPVTLIAATILSGSRSPSRRTPHRSDHTHLVGWTPHTSFPYRRWHWVQASLGTLA